MLKINKKFAKRYDEYRRKEELQKLKDRFGSANASDLKAAAAEESSSESEDSDAEAWTPEVEKGFLRVYAALQAKDSRLYDPSVRWFDDEKSDGDGDGGGGEDEGGKAAGDGAHKPMYFNEYQRQYLLQKGYERDDGEENNNKHDEEDEERPEDAEGNSAEAAQLRASLRAQASDDSEAGDEFLVKRGDQQQQQDDDPVQQLHSFLTDQSNDGRQLDSDCRQELKRLKRFWADERLSEEEKYLRDFITKEYWRNPQQDSVPTYKEVVGSDDAGSLSADEDFLTRQKEFEEKWNNRTEEQDEEFEQNFRRTFASADRPAEDEDDDDELFVAKATSDSAPAVAGEGDDSEEAPNEVLDELRRLEAERQWALDSELLHADDGEQQQQEADGVRTYPRAVPDSLRQSAANARARSRAERRDRRREEKRRRVEEIDRLVDLRQEELQRRLLRLGRNAGTDAVASQLDPTFMDADFDPDEHDRRMAAIFDSQFYGQDELAAARPTFSDDEQLDGDDGDDGDDEASLRQRLLEAERQQAEDFIAGGPGEGELRCRFAYRQVEPNDFGLDPVEILLADDKELNAWCSVKKMSQYRHREAELRDRRRYRSAKRQEKKLRLMPMMLQRVAEAEQQTQQEQQQQQEEEKKSELKESSVGAEAPASRKRRRRKKRQRTEQQQQQQQQQPRSRQSSGRRRPVANGDADASEAPEQQQQQQQQQQQRRQRKRKAADGGSGGERLQISDERLRELGLQPKKFKRLERLRRQQRRQQPDAFADVDDDAGDSGD